MSALIQTPIAAAIQTPASAPVTNAYHNGALFAELSISVWTGRKLDRNATKAVTANAGANDRAGSFHKKLLGDCAELEAIQKFAANARNWHYSNTAPWNDLGMRMLPTVRYPDYYNEVTSLQAEFYALRDAFLQAYAWAETQARVALGALYNSDDYPSVDQLKSKFSFSHHQQPVPTGGNWQLDMLNEHAQRLQESYAADYTARLDASMQDVWQRTYDALVKMSERLDYVGGDAKDKKIFRDSLVHNLFELIPLLDAFNIQNDSRMSSMARALEDALTGVNPDALREDDTFRKETKAKVDAILSTMSW